MSDLPLSMRSARFRPLLAMLLLCLGLTRAARVSDTSMGERQAKPAAASFSQLRAVPASEHVARQPHGQAVLSLLEAERFVSGHVAEALELARVRQSAVAREVGGNTSQLNATEEERAFWDEMRSAREQAHNQTSEDFRKEQLEKLKRGFKPTIQAHMCIQVKFDMSSITMIPGTAANVGLMGGISYDNRNGCFGGTFEISLGFDWSFKVYGFEMGLGAAVTGSLDLTEIPWQSALDDPESTIHDTDVLAPDGADYKLCHSHTPWIAIMAYVEYEWRQTYAANATMHPTHMSNIDNYTQKVQEFTSTYTPILNSSFKIENASSSSSPSTPFISAPELVAPSVAMNHALHRFVERLPAYADQVLGRLVDNNRWLVGTDNERSQSRAWKRAKTSTGRFLARWPSSGDLEHFSPEGGGVSGLEGVKVSGSGQDQRVMNFAKTMRLSENAGEVRFWKELAMSAGNLAVRVVADVQALFSASFAHDPHWDGVCGSLSPSFVVEALGNDVLGQYPWASRSSRQRTAFATKKHDSMERSHGRAAHGLREWQVNGTASSPSLMLPHLWCTLAEHAPRDLGPAAWNIGALESFQNAREPLELSLTQACVTVGNSLRQLNAEEFLRWDIWKKRYQVWRNYTMTGVLFDPEENASVCYSCFQISGYQSQSDVAEAAALRGYMVLEKTLETRAECEHASLSVAFQRMFPHFALKAEQFVVFLEAALLRINTCMEETHSSGRLMKRFARYPGIGVVQNPQNKCASSRRQLKLVRRLAKHMVSQVRTFLFSLGAEDPRDAVSGYQPGSIPLNNYEKQLLESAESEFAPITSLMAEDFGKAFGLRLRPDKEFLEEVADYINPQQSWFALYGRFWKLFPDVGDQLLATVDVLSRLDRDAKLDRLRPPLEMTRGLSVTGQLSPNGYCTPNAGLIMVQHITQSTKRTWSTATSSESCWVGRILPGAFFIQVLRCSGRNHDGAYVDWRVRWQAAIVKGNVFGQGASGIIGNAMTLSVGKLGPLLTSGGAIAGGILATNAVERFAPHVHNSTWTTAMLMLGASSAPLLGAVGVTTVVSSASSFKAIIKKFMENLANHGIVSHPSSDGMSHDSLGLRLDAMLVMWGATVHRQKEVTLLNAPNHPVGPVTAVLSQRFVAMHVENRNRFNVEKTILGAETFSLFAKLEFDWDVTPWIERSVNFERFAENQVRVDKCLACIDAGQSFCDWRMALGSLWTEALDICIESSDFARQRCERRLAIDDSGEVVQAAHYSIKDGAAACYDINFQRSNKEFRKHDMLRHFFQRH